MPLYGLLLAAATASGFPFAGGGSLMGAQFPSAHAHPGAVIWAPRYLLVTSLNRRWPSPDLDVETTALDPGRGALGASVGARYRYEGGEQHLLGGSLALGLRLGGGFGLGVAGAYDPEIKWSDTLRYGLSYAGWQRATSSGTRPGLVVALDYDSGLLAADRWRGSIAVNPIDSLRLVWDHRLDGSNLLAAGYRLGSAEVQASGSFSSAYATKHYGLGMRWHDRGGWLGMSWSTQGTIRHIAFEVTVPIGTNAAR